MMNAEVLAFVLYFVLMLAIGVVFFFKERGAGEKEYFLGGRHMGPWVTAMSASSRLDPGLRLWPDLDRYRPRPRHDRELGHRRAPSSLLLGGRERLDHAAAVPV